MQAYMLHCKAWAGIFGCTSAAEGAWREGAASWEPPVAAACACTRAWQGGRPVGTGAMLAAASTTAHPACAATCAKVPSHASSAARDVSTAAGGRQHQALPWGRCARGRHARRSQNQRLLCSAAEPGLVLRQGTAAGQADGALPWPVRREQPAGAIGSTIAPTLAADDGCRGLLQVQKQHG